MVRDLSTDRHVTVYLATLSTYLCVTKGHLCTQEGRGGGRGLLIETWQVTVAEAQGRSAAVCGSQDHVES